MTGRAVAALTQSQAADLAGLTIQGIAALSKSADPPPRGSAGIPAMEYGQWLKRRHLRGMGVDSEGVRYDYEQERARLTKAQADKTELEARELHGEMVRVDVISVEWARMLGNMRQRLLAIPQKSAPRARGAASDVEAAAVLEAEILEALGELSEDGLDERTRARQARSPARDSPASETDGKRVGRPRKASVA